MKSIALTLAVLFGALNVVAIAEEAAPSTEQQKPLLEEVAAEEGAEAVEGEQPKK